MNALGFVVKDTECSGKFITEFGVDYKWSSNKPGIQVVRETGVTTSKDSNSGAVASNLATISKTSSGHSH